MCCALDIIPLGGRVDLDGTRTENLFRAIELSVPSVIAHLRVVHRDENNKVLDSREYNFDLNSGGDCQQFHIETIFWGPEKGFQTLVIDLFDYQDL